MVVGRYGITSSQAAAAAEIAETFRTSGKLEAVQKAYVIRYIGVYAGPLTAEQASKEPASIAKAAQRLGHYGVEFDGSQPTRPIAIYDAIRHRVIHGRLYTVTEVPARYDYMRWTTSSSCTSVPGERKEKNPCRNKSQEPESRSQEALGA